MTRENMPRGFEAYLHHIVSDATLKSLRRQLIPPQVVLPSQDTTDNLWDMAEALTGSATTIIVGSPGAGKTTLLQSILYDYALHGEGDDFSSSPLCDEERVPIYLDLATKKPGEGWEELAFRCLAAHLPSPSVWKTALGGDELLFLIDHWDRQSWGSQMEAMKAIQFLNLYSPRHRIVLAVREHDLPFFESWSAQKVILAPLDQETAYRYMCQMGGEENARRMANILTQVGLWGLAESPGSVSRMGPLTFEGSAPTVREFLSRLVGSILGPGNTQRWYALGKLALTMMKENRETLEVVRCRPILEDGLWGVLGDEVWGDLVRAGVLRLTEGRQGLAFSHSEYRAFFAAFALEAALVGGQSLTSLLSPEVTPWARAVVHLYGMTSRRRAVLDQLLAPPFDPQKLTLVVDCLVENEPSGRLLVALRPSTTDSRLHLYLAQAFQEAGRFQEALEEIDEAIMFSPQRPDLHYRRGQILSALGKHQTALRAFQEASVYSPQEWEISLATEQAKAGDRGGAKKELSRLAGVLKQRRAQALYELSRLKMEEGLLKEAEEDGREAVALWPQGDLWHHLGGILMAQGRREEARQILQMAANNHALASAALGVLAEEEGRYSEALTHFRRAVELAPTEAPLHCQLGRVCRLAGQYSSGSFHLQRAAHLRPDYGEAYAEMARLLECQERHHDALEQARRACDVEPENPEHHELRGWLARSIGRLDEAETHMRQAVKLNPERGEWHNGLGVILWDKGNHLQAVVEYREAIRLEPANPMYYRNLGVAYTSMTDDEAALEAFEGALHQCEDGEEQEISSLSRFIAADVSNERGAILENHGKHQLALVEFQRAARLVPQRTDYRLNEGLIYGRLSQPYQMLHLLEKAAASQPHDPIVHYRLGQAYELLDCVQEAVTEYQTTTELSPTEGEFWKSLGRVQRRMGNLQEAASSLEKATSLQPGDAEVLFYLADIWEEEGQMSSAVDSYLRAARRAVDRAEYWLAAGRASRRAGRWGEAQTCLRTALSLDSGLAEARFELSQTLAKLGRVPEAAEEVKTALEACPKHVEGHFLLASIMESLGRGEEALAAARRGLEMDPSHVPGYRQIAKILVSLGREGEARELYGKVVALAPASADIYMEAGSLYFKQGLTQEAIDLWERAVAAEPHRPEGHFLLARGLLESQPASGGERALYHCQQALTGEERAEYHALAASVLERLEREEEALSHWNAATKLEPSSPQWLYQLGRMAEKRGEGDRAEEYYAAATRQAGGGFCYCHLARLYYQKGQYSEAVRAVQLGLEVGVNGDDLPPCYQQLGDALLALGRGGEAQHAYNTALQLGYESGILHRQLAVLCLAGGAVAEAVTHLERAMALGDDPPATHQLMAEALIRQGEGEMALAYAQRAFQAEPGNFLYRRQMGSTHRYLKRWEEAIAYLREALDVSPQDGGTWGELGLAYLGAGRGDEALAALREAVSLGRAESRLPLGRLLLERDRVKEACEELKEATNLSPDSAEAHFYLGRALEELGETDAALRAYQGAVSLGHPDPEARYRLAKL
ncbi:MAG: tetratricopeptide repeat protein, partial [Chloroflexi bacterium]|nr:tetratricopeptide repeat protein [Chloroflexota bacterium]